MSTPLRRTVQQANNYNFMTLSWTPSSYYPSKDEDGAIIRPLPKVKHALSDTMNLPHIVQLLLTFDPVLVEKVAILLHLVLEDNSRLATLYLTGCFFFILMYTGSNLLPIGKFMAMAHVKQAFRSEDREGGGSPFHSIIAQMLPDAMVAYLVNHGPDKFAEIFLGDFDTPEAIWKNDMRQFMIQKIAYHIADFTPRLKSNVRALYQYCPIPMIGYPQLENELFCDIYYLRNLCDTAKFSDWPVITPLNLLREVLQEWKKEVEKKPTSMTAKDAMTLLGLGNVQEPDETKIRKAYFKMAQQYHPDKNPKGRDMFEKVNAAYEFLCSRASKASDAPDADNIVLILRTQSILFSRYSEELHPYKYAGYPMLIKTIRMETDDDKLFSKSAPLLAAASECAYFTVKCSALNAEELRRENGLEVLYQAFERCVSVLSQSSKIEDVGVQVCMHVIRFYSVASMFPACREKMVEMPELVKNICRVFYYKVRAQYYMVKRYLIIDGGDLPFLSAFTPDVLRGVRERLCPCRRRHSADALPSSGRPLAPPPIFLRLRLHPGRGRRRGGRGHEPAGCRKQAGQAGGQRVRAHGRPPRRGRPGQPQKPCDRGEPSRHAHTPHCLPDEGERGGRGAQATQL